MATITTFKTNALPTKTVGILQLQTKIPTAAQKKNVITTVARPVVSQQAATAENVKLDIIKQTSKPASNFISWIPEKQQTAVQTPENVQTEYFETTYTPSANFGIGQNLAPHPEPEQTVQQQTTVQAPATTTQQQQAEQTENHTDTAPVEQVAEQTAPATDDKKKKIIFIIIAVIAIWLLFFKKD